MCQGRINRCDCTIPRNWRVVPASSRSGNRVARLRSPLAWHISSSGHCPTIGLWGSMEHSCRAASRLRYSRLRIARRGRVVGEARRGRCARWPFRARQRELMAGGRPWPAATAREQGEHHARSANLRPSRVGQIPQTRSGALAVKRARQFAHGIAMRVSVVRRNRRLRLPTGPCRHHRAPGEANPPARSRNRGMHGGCRAPSTVLGAVRISAATAVLDRARARSAAAHLVAAPAPPRTSP